MLREANAAGFIPGPEENETLFWQRVQQGKKLKETLHREEALAFAEPDQLKEAFEELRKRYRSAPLWAPITFSNQKLLPWHGAVTWIFKEGALIQLRHTFKENTSYLGIYQRQTLLTHELAHIGRMAFHEPRYEEILAYRLSTRPLERWLGGVLQSATESWFFVASCLSVLVLDLFLLFFGSWQTYWMGSWLKILPLALFIYAFLRLIKRQICLRRTLKKLEKIYKDKAEAILYRLTDKEIDLFATLPVDAIAQYGHNASCLRWQAIKTL